MRRINAEILKCEMTLLGMELGCGQSWKEQLRQVLDLVNGMEGAWYIQAIQGTLNGVILKIISLDIRNEHDWGVFHSLIGQCLVAFKILEHVPGDNVDKIFKSLYGGLNSQFVKTKTWMEITDESKKNEKILSILKSLGDAIKNIRNQDIVLIVGEDGLTKMKRIAEILKTP